MDRSVRHPSAAIYSLPSPTAESVRPVVCCPWQGHSPNPISKVRSPKKPDPISNHLDHRGPGLPNSRHTPSRCSLVACSGSRCPWVSYSRSLLQSDAQAKLRLGLSRPTALCKVQKSTRHFSNKKFSNKFVQNPIPLPPTTSSRSERGWQTQRERETSLGVPRLALRGECCGWGASASRRGRRRGSVGRAPAPPGPRRLPVASSRPSQDPAGRNQPRPRCPAGPPPRRGRPWCGGTS